MRYFHVRHDRFKGQGHEKQCSSKFESISTAGQKRSLTRRHSPSYRPRNPLQLRPWNVVVIRREEYALRTFRTILVLIFTLYRLPIEHPGSTMLRLSQSISQFKLALSSGMTSQ